MHPPPPTHALKHSKMWRVNYPSRFCLVVHIEVRVCVCCHKMNAKLAPYPGLSDILYSCSSCVCTCKCCPTTLFTQASRSIAITTFPFFSYQAFHREWCFLLWFFFLRRWWERSCLSSSIGMTSYPNPQYPRSFPPPTTLLPFFFWVFVCVCTLVCMSVRVFSYGNTNKAYVCLPMVES